MGFHPSVPNPLVPLSSALLSSQACIDGSMEMVSFLVEHHASVNQADSEGWTPLHVAASCGHTDIAECVGSPSRAQKGVLHVRLPGG